VLVACIEEVEVADYAVNGTLGTVPNRELRTRIDVQGAWGGNLDMRDAAAVNWILM